MNGEHVRAKNTRYVSYLRVSTSRQGESGLGLQAQRQAVLDYLNGADYELLREFQEVETGKGANALDKRPVLREALDYAKQQKAVLVIARLDRLARNVHFISGLIETGAEFVAADVPNADKFMLHIYAAVSEQERDQISKRTRAALAAAKRKGTVLGNPRLQENAAIIERNANEFADSLRPVLIKLQKQGLPQRAMVDELNRQGVRTRHGKQFQLTSLQRVLKRIESAD